LVWFQCLDARRSACIQTQPRKDPIMRPSVQWSGQRDRACFKACALGRRHSPLRLAASHTL
jgi:hypothetical protein